MGQKGIKLDQRTRERLEKMGREGVDPRDAARALQVADSTARRIFKNVIDRDRPESKFED